MDEAISDCPLYRDSIAPRLCFLTELYGYHNTVCNMHCVPHCVLRLDWSPPARVTP